MSRKSKTTAQNKREQQRRDQLQRKIYLGEAEPEKEPLIPVFKGYMLIPLRSNADFDDLLAGTRFTEDWAVDSHQILKEERRYKITLHLPLIGEGNNSLVYTGDYNLKNGMESIVETIGIIYDSMIKDLEPEQLALIHPSKGQTVVRA
jgi:hypothetical protein